MTINEAIAHAREVAAKQRSASSEWLEQSNEEGSLEEEISKGCEKCAQEHEQLAKWLEELKELREYQERMEIQYLDDMNNPLEPLKLQNALNSEIMKYEFRKKNKPEEINILDYTVMYALKHCLEEMAEVSG